MKPIGLVPELFCSDIKQSLNFYELLGFTIVYQRPEDQFAYIKKGNAEIMLEELSSESAWQTGKLELPFGRGVNFQIETERIDALYATISKHNIKVFLPIDEKWYRKDNSLVGNRQFIVQDPDGYLLRFYEDLGVRVS